MPGLLDIGQNPLVNIGLGLLQGGGPNNPNQWAGGLNQGLLNLRGANQQRQQQELLDMRKSSYEADERYRTGQASRAEFEARYKRAQQAAEAQRNEQFIQSLPPEQQQIARAMGVGNFAKMQGEQMFAEPEKGTSAMQEYAQAQAQGFQGSFIDYQTMMKKAGRAVTNVNMPGSKPSRPLTPEEAPGWGIAPEDAPNYMFDFEGNLKARPVSDNEKSKMSAAAKKEDAVKTGRPVIDAYKAAAKTYRDGTSPFGTANANAKRARQAAVAWYAKNILGTPGAEPTPKLYDQAELAIPDYSGVYDGAVFDEKMKLLENDALSALGDETQTSETQTDDGFTVKEVK